MARILANKTNVDAPTATYPKGKIRNNPGNNTGTPVNELLYGDFHQFFDIFPGLGQVILNDLAENAINGFQYIVALQNIPKIQYDIFRQIGASLQPPYQNSFATSAFINALDGLRWMYDPKTDRTYFQGACQRATESAAIAFTLPIAARPATDRMVPCMWYNTGTTTYRPCLMKVVAATGAVSFVHNAGDGATLATYIVDGISFNRQ